MNLIMKQAIMKAFPGEDVTTVEIRPLRSTNLSNEEMLMLDEGEFGD
jgi:hypothetical protein